MLSRLPLAAALGLLCAPARDELTLTRSFALEFELATTSFHLTGTENGKSEERDAPPVRRAESELLEVRDRCADGADPLARFERDYETVASSYAFDGGPEPVEETVTAGLEGKTITFEREDEDEWSRTTDAAGVNERQLERLRADLRLAVLLPEGESEIGTSWELPYATFERLVAPLGRVGARQRRRTVAGGRGGLDLAPAALVEPLWLLFAKAEGVATCTRIEPEEGAALPALAELEFRFTSSYDGAKHLLRGQDTGPEIEDELQATLRGTGTLAWDPESGALELRLEGELEFEEEFSVAFEGNGVEAEVAGELECSGKFELVAKEERAE